MQLAILGQAEVEGCKEVKIAKTAKSPSDIRKEYLDDCRFRGCTRRTTTNYGNLLNHFLHGRKQIPTEPAEIRGFLASFKANTYRTYWHHLSAFYQYLEREYGLANPMPKVPKPREDKGLPAHLNPEQKTQLEQAELSRRDRAIIKLLADTAIRPGEVCGEHGHPLRFCDIYDDHIKVWGKRGERVVPINAETRSLLLSLQQGQPSDNPVIRLTEWGLRKVVRRAFRAAGIAGVRASPYTLRHSFGGDYLARGGDLATLQKILGHANVKTTMVYIHLADKQMFSSYKRYGPGATIHRFVLDTNAIIQRTSEEMPPAQPGVRAPIDTNLVNLMDRMIALGETAKELKRQLGGNDHRAENLGDKCLDKAEG